MHFEINAGDKRNMRKDESRGFKSNSHWLNNLISVSCFSFKICQTEYGEYIGSW